MENKSITEAIGRLGSLMWTLEQMYIDNEGEVTPETDTLEHEIQTMKDLLTTEGVDSLGRWLKSKEDEKKALKAEKDYVSRKINAVDRTIDYVKSRITQVMDITGQEKVKGTNGYSFSRYTSITTSVDKDMIKDRFQQKVEDALRGVIPVDITVTLGASVKAVPEDDPLPDYYVRTDTESVRFAKPKANKED